jgi:hypothetical protein
MFSHSIFLRSILLSDFFLTFVMPVCCSVLTFNHCKYLITSFSWILCRGFWRAVKHGKSFAQENYSGVVDVKFSVRKGEWSAWEPKLEQECKGIFYSVSCFVKYRVRRKNVYIVQIPSVKVCIHFFGGLCITEKEYSCHECKRVNPNRRRNICLIELPSIKGGKKSREFKNSITW